MEDFGRLGAAALAWTAHDALARGDLPLFDAVRAEIARRPPAQREACRREWIGLAAGDGEASAALDLPASGARKGYRRRGW
ncbi:MAG: hypothetical protein ICV73_27740 [Acetobacteraceae bacterium]|nr:hypothetical protein [Acetobacteraceae bacterium]